MGLDLILSPDANDYISYIRSFVGTQISIHGQDEYSDNRNVIIALAGYDYKLFITPTVVHSDQSVNFQKLHRSMHQMTIFSFSDSFIANQTAKMLIFR